MPDRNRWCSRELAPEGDSDEKRASSHNLTPRPVCGGTTTRGFSVLFFPRWTSRTGGPKNTFCCPDCPGPVPCPPARTSVGAPKKHQRKQAIRIHPRRSGTTSQHRQSRPLLSASVRLVRFAMTIRDPFPAATERKAIGSGTGQIATYCSDSGHA